MNKKDWYLEQLKNKDSSTNKFIEEPDEVWSGFFRETDTIKTYAPEEGTIFSAKKKRQSGEKIIENNFTPQMVQLLRKIKNNGSDELKNIDDSLKANRDFMIEAIHNSYGFAFKYADISLRMDDKVVLEAVKRWVHSLEYASEKLKANRKFMIKAIKKDSSALFYANETLKADRELVLKATKKDGSSLKYVHESLKADREVVIEAVKSWGHAL